MSLNVMPISQKLTRSQQPAAIATLAQAFLADPIMQYFYAVDPESRLRGLHWLSQLTLRYCQPYNQIYVSPTESSSEAVKGCAIWMPPGTYPLKLWQLLRLGFFQLPFYVRRDRLMECLTFFEHTEVCHKEAMPEPHWYLVMLGVAPAFQGQGVGKILLKPVLDAADRDGVPCYLETSTEGGVRFYQRLGFEILRVEQRTPAAPTFWTMRRNPA